MRLFILDPDNSIYSDYNRFLEDTRFEIIGYSKSFKLAFDEINKQVPDVVISAYQLNEDKTTNDLAVYLKQLEIPLIIVNQNNDDVIYQKIKSINSECKLINKNLDKFTLISILECVEKSSSKIGSDKYLRGSYLFVRHNNVFEKLNLVKVRYLYSEGNYTSLVFNDKKYLVKFSLLKLMELGQFSEFIRIHRNYAIPVSSISKVDLAHKQVDVNGEILPLGRTYIKSVKEALNLRFAQSN